MIDREELGVDGLNRCQRFFDDQFLSEKHFADQPSLIGKRNAADPSAKGPDPTLFHGLLHRVRQRSFGNLHPLGQCAKRCHSNETKFQEKIGERR